MKICYVSNNFEIHDKRFLVKFVENNYDVHAVSFRKNGIDDNFKVNGVKYYEFCKVRKSYQKRFHGLNPFWYIATVKYLKKIVKEINPDILHGGYASISGFICALSGFHPFLLMPWGSDILFDPKRNPVINKMVSFSIKHSDMITCDAETVKKRIVENYGHNSNKIIVFPWGIDLNVFNPDNNNIPENLLEWRENFIVICTRQHKEVYGIDYLIESIPFVVKENRNVRFLFIGDGPLTNTYINQVKRLNVENYTKFIGRVKNENLPLYLNNSHIYVSPSLSDGSSLCLMEALACGLPVVVTNIEANHEWVKENINGILVAPKNTEDLVNAIVKLSKDKGLCSSIIKRNLQIAKDRANWNINFSKLEKIYQQLGKNLFPRSYD